MVLLNEDCFQKPDLTSAPRLSEQPTPMQIQRLSRRRFFTSSCLLALGIIATCRARAPSSSHALAGVHALLHAARQRGQPLPQRLEALEGAWKGLVEAKQSFCGGGHWQVQHGCPEG
eukprot:scaffold757_cov246-Pinguiococcus_pyrenoidosus.AAC.33